MWTVERSCRFGRIAAPSALRLQVRSLSIHEYQAQKLLRQSGASVARAGLAHSPVETEAIAMSLGGPCVLKSQVLPGGCGKGYFDSGLQGGTQIAKSPLTARQLSSRMLGHQLYTEQSAGKPLKVDRLYVTELVEAKDEYYLAITINRSTYRPALIVSKHGDRVVEKIPEPDTESLIELPIEYTVGITPEIVSRVSQELDLDSGSSEKLGDLLKKLYGIFVHKDATFLEINPLVRDQKGQFICLGAKFSFDNAAAKRQPELFTFRDKTHEDAAEIEAEESGLVYVRLDGNIGNVVNGAGLAMATNDAISYYGGESANFLDAGGQATTETMVKAFDIILRDPRVRVILVNIYGGIIRCDMIAESIISAAAQLGPLRCPIVVRLQGTNSEEGQIMIAKSGLNLFAESDFSAAAQRAVIEAEKFHNELSDRPLGMSIGKT